MCSRARAVSASKSGTRPRSSLRFRAALGWRCRNEVTGAVLPVEGTPHYVAGKKGQALETDNKKTFVRAGSLDLYRKPFTLAAWVNIEALENRQATFFGGTAPMGADIDIVGTSLAGCIFDDNLLLTFRNRD